jgi:CubicO group peptidase (beta-lactamase class C family)
MANISTSGPSASLKRHLGLETVAKSCLAQAFKAGYPTPALYGGVVRHDGFYGEFACGKRNANNPKYGNASCGDRVHIGSMTKQMTAGMVRNALRGPAPTNANQGLASVLTPGQPRSVGWTTKLGEVLPLPSNSIMGEATLESFFDHTSGLLDHKMLYGLDFSTVNGWCRAARLLPKGTFLGAQECWAPYFVLDQPGLPLDPSLPPKVRLEQKLEWMTDLCSKVDWQYTPQVVNQRGRYYYSNFGIALGSLIIEASFGLPYEQLLKEQVFDPCGMSTAGFGEPAVHWRRLAAEKGEVTAALGVGNADAKIGDAAAAFGHNYNGPWFLPRRMTFSAIDRDSVVPTLIRPAGDVHCSIRDHLSFLHSEMMEVRNCTDWKSERFVAPNGPMSSTQPNAHYRRGWVVLHNKKGSTNPDTMETSTGASQSSADPEMQLDGWDPFQTHFCLLHDGSSGVWYGLCGVFPELGLSAVAVTNSASLWAFGDVGKCVKALVREAARLPPEVDGETETDLDDGEERPRSAV